MSPAVLMFLGFIAVTLWITWWAARKSAGSSAFFAAGRSLKASDELTIRRSPDAKSCR